MEEMKYLGDLKKMDLKMFGKVSPETQTKLDDLKTRIQKAKEQDQK